MALWRVFPRASAALPTLAHALRPRAGPRSGAVAVGCTRHDRIRCSGCSLAHKFGRAPARALTRCDADRNTVELKLDTFSGVYNKLTGKQCSFEFKESN